MLETVVNDTGAFTVLSGQTVIVFFTLWLTVRGFKLRDRGREATSRRECGASASDPVGTALIYVTACFATSTLVMWLHFFGVV